MVSVYKTCSWDDGFTGTFRLMKSWTVSQEPQFSPYDSMQLCFFLSLVFPFDATVTLGISTPMLSDVFSPHLLCSESSEEESTGEREEEIGAHNEATSSTKTTKVPAEHTSNTQTGEVKKSHQVECVYSAFVPPWTLTFVWVAWPYWNYLTVGCVLSRIRSLCWLLLLKSALVNKFFLWLFFPEEVGQTEGSTFFGRTSWLSFSCLQCPLWHSFLSESLTEKWTHFLYAEFDLIS